MANLDPQVQIKLIEISEKWAEKAGEHADAFSIPKVYPKEFANIYKQLIKTMAEEQT